jgi:serine/threonine protein kinase/Flp pilus assembly protein TadD
MGEVWRVFDQRLGRHLAMKVIRPSFADLEVARRRFEVEARITARLQHPGVVPVHGFGLLEGGRPFLSLKLVKGRTLARILEERASPAQDLPLLLKIFEQIAETIAFAHAQGVCHRDLKPGNVMVGAYGEVHVMDWGLACELATDPLQHPSLHSRHSTIGEAAADTPASSRTAEPLGTYAYMAPEQALGRGAGVERRADVFGLGAVLCEILTGVPPYWSDAPEPRCRQEVRRQSESGDLSKAVDRLKQCGGDPELVKLALRCIAAEPSARPANSAVVAAAVAAHQAAVAQRLRRKEVAEATAVENSRRRRAILGMTCAALVAIGSVSYGLHLRRRHNEEQQAAIAADIERASKLRDQRRWKEASDALAAAEAAASPEDPAVRTKIDAARRDLALAARLDEIRRARAADTDDEWDWLGTDRAYASAFCDHLGLQIGLDPDRTASAIRNTSIAPQILSALDDWAGFVQEGTCEEWIWKISSRLTEVESHRRFRDPAVWADKDRLRPLVPDAIRAELPAALLVTLLARAPLTADERIYYLRKARRNHPSDFWINLELGIRLQSGSRTGEALGFLRLADAEGPTTAALQNRLGALCRRENLVHDAAFHLLHALELDPNYARAHANLGQVASRLSPRSGAKEANAAATRAVLATVASHYGIELKGAPEDRLEVSIHAYKEALRLRPAYAEAHNNIGSDLMEIGRTSEAFAHLKRAHELRPKLDQPLRNLLEMASGDAMADEAWTIVSKSPEDRLLVLLEQQAQSALKSGRSKLAAFCFAKLVELKPDSPADHLNLAFALRDSDRLAESVVSFRRSLAVNPNDPEGWWCLAEVLRLLNRSEDAVAAYRSMLDILPRDPRPWLPLSQTLRKLNRVSEARDVATKGMTILPVAHRDRTALQSLAARPSH